MSKSSGNDILQPSFHNTGSGRDIFWHSRIRTEGSKKAAKFLCSHSKSANISETKRDRELKIVSLRSERGHPWGPIRKNRCPIWMACTPPLILGWVLRSSDNFFSQSGPIWQGLKQGKCLKQGKFRPNLEKWPSTLTAHIFANLGARGLQMVSLEPAW